MYCFCKVRLDFYLRHKRKCKGETLTAKKAHIQFLYTHHAQHECSLQYSMIISHVWLSKMHTVIETENEVKKGIFLHDYTPATLQLQIGTYIGINLRLQPQGYIYR